MNAEPVAELRALRAQVGKLQNSILATLADVDDELLMTPEEVSGNFMIHPKTLMRWQRTPELEFPQPLPIEGAPFLRAEIEDFYKAMSRKLDTARRGDKVDYQFLATTYGDRVAQFLVRNFE